MKGNLISREALAFYIDAQIMADRGSPDADKQCIHTTIALLLSAIAVELKTMNERNERNQTNIGDIQNDY